MSRFFAIESPKHGVIGAEAMARINRQISEETKMRLCDFIIVNDEQQLVIPQVLELHQKFQQMVLEN